MKTLYRRIADTILLLHIVVVVIILFGWALPQQLFWMYQTTVILTFVLGVLHRGTCILTKYEWQFRRKYQLGEYNDSLFIPFYLKRYLGIAVSEKWWNLCTATIISILFLVEVHRIFFS